MIVGDHHHTYHCGLMNHRMFVLIMIMTLLVTSIFFIVFLQGVQTQAKKRVQLEYASPQVLSLNI